MKATKSQKQIIQIETKKNGYDGYKEELVQWATEDVEKTSCNDLSFVQANHILVKLDKKPHSATANTVAWRAGQFNIENTQHLSVLSLCHQLGWTQPHPRLNKQVPDIERLGRWLLSKKSPVQLPLKDMTIAQCSKIIHAMESMTVKTHKQ